MKFSVVRNAYVVGAAQNYLVSILLAARNSDWLKAFSKAALSLLAKLLPIAAASQAAEASTGMEAWRGWGHVLAVPLVLAAQQNETIE